MDCNSCHQPLLQGAKVCSNCGAPTAAYYGSSGTSSDVRTAPSAPANMPSGPFGMPSNRPSGPSGMPVNTPSNFDSNPYSNAQSNPYTNAPPPPPPPSQYSVPLPPATPPVQRPKNRAGWSIGATLLALVLIGAGVFLFLSKAGPNPGVPGVVPSSTSSSTTGSTQTQSTYAVKLDATTAQKLYDSTIAGSPVMNEGLGAPDSYGWDHVKQANTSCTFADGAYHAQANPGYFGPCYAAATNFSDFLLQVQMTMVSGHAGGVVFRATDTNDNEYQFRISTDGTYILNKYVANNGNPVTTPLLSGTSATIVNGMNQHNLIAVLAQGNTIALYINKKYVGVVNDGTYQQGQIGVYTDSDPSSVVDAAFNKLQVWNLHG